MTSTATATVPAQRRKVCDAHGVAHRPGTTAYDTCPDRTLDAAPTVVVGAEVTVDHVQAALGVYGGRIALVRVGSSLAVIAGAFTAGETLVDRTDLLNLLDVLGGSLEAAADDLSLAVRFERAQLASAA